MTASRRPPDPAALQRRIDDLEHELAACQRLANELRESEERLRILTEATSETVVLLERGVVVDCNAQVGPMFGYDVSEVLGRPALDFVDPGSRARAADNIRSGYEQPYEAVMVRRDGTLVPCIFRGKTAIFRGRPARVTIIREQTVRPRDVPLLALAPDVALLPNADLMTVERARPLLAAAPPRVLLVDVSGVTVDDPLAAGLVALAAELAAAGGRLVVTGAVDLPGLVDVAQRATLAEAVREALSLAP